MKHFRGAVVILFTILPMLTARASSPDPLFQDDAPLQVEITAPFSQLIRERPKDRELPGSFTFRDSNGVSIELDVKVRARGRYRHTNCDFPPLFLNFKRSQLDGTLFEQQNKLKVVAHCKESLRYQQSVLREYLAYRMLNFVTDRIFHPSSVRMTSAATTMRCSEQTALRWWRFLTISTCPDSFTRPMRRRTRDWASTTSGNAFTRDSA